MIEINQRYDYLKHDMERPICSPATISMEQHEFHTKKKTLKNVDIFAASKPFKISKLPDLGLENGINNDLDKSCS